MPSQVTDKILMIKPKEFYKNPQTAENNYFQKDGPEGDLATQKCHAELAAFAKRLADIGLGVQIFNQPLPEAVDAIFPNNWFSTHADGTLVLYPMFAPNRRIERSQELISDLKKKYGYRKMVDLTHFEGRNKFCEGTGSLVLDRVAKIAYCALSPRSDTDVASQFCEALSYTPCFFTAVQVHEGQQKLIYHTNVVMSVGEAFATICLESIPDAKERQNILRSFEKTRKSVIEISIEQMHSFAGNILELGNGQGKKFIVMSEKAKGCLHPDQVKAYEKCGTIVSESLETIETLGGGSARCMIAEIFAP